MDEFDIIPCTTPTLEQQRDALKKGLGRAAMWAATGKLDPELLLEACLHDWRYDWQCEEPRGSWLWGLVRTCGTEDRFRKPILDAFMELSEDLAVQICGLARHYAAAGDAEFRTRLHDVVTSKPIPTMDWLGESDVVELEAEVGFQFAAGVRGDRLDSDPWEWSHRSLADNAVERWGRERTIQLLRESNRPGCQQFLAVWIGQSEDRTTDARDAHRLRMQAIPVSDVLAAASNKDRCVWFRGWGMYAGDKDIHTIHTAILNETDTHRLSRLLRIFHVRPFPEIEPRILELVHHLDDEVRWAAVRALKPVRNPAIRTFALELLNRSDTVDSAIALVIKNSATGDENRILAAVSTLNNAEDLHGALMNARDVLSENVEANPVPLALFIYRHTPCGHCREAIAEYLFERDVAPPWMKDELQSDSYEDSRKLVSSTSSVENEENP